MTWISVEDFPPWGTRTIIADRQMLPMGGHSLQSASGDCGPVLPHSYLSADIRFGQLMASLWFLSEEFENQSLWKIEDEQFIECHRDSSRSMTPTRSHRRTSGSTRHGQNGGFTACNADLEILAQFPSRRFALAV